MHRIILLDAFPRISTAELIEVMESQNALMHIEEMKFESGRDEWCSSGMPALPGRQTYVPKLNRKSKRW